jgi:hypothetical protein
MFISIMSALGNILSFLTIKLVPVLPSIPLGSINISIALDLSHLTTLIAAYLGGPIPGGLTGILGGIVAAYEFGFSNGNYITGILLPVGKGIAGIAAGLLYNWFEVDENVARNILVTTISYIPEAAIVYLIFMVLMPAFMGLPMIVAVPLTIQINLKAFAEMIFLEY